MRIRPNTWDEAIARSVLIENEYDLPDDMAGKVVMDIGAHIGSFALACQRRNAAKVICFEADVENFEMLKHNIRETKDTNTRITVYRAGVVGRVNMNSEYGIRRLSEHDGDKGRNTGHIDIFGKGDDVPVIGIAEAIKSVEADWIDLVKIDCEGSEWLILEHIDLSKIRQLIIEIHEPPKSDHPDLVNLTQSLPLLSQQLTAKLRSAGFETSVICGDQLGKVWARRRAEHTRLSGKPRLLWVGDAAVNTGYGRVTEQICRRLVAKGWDVSVLGIGYNGDPHNYPYKIYPAVDPNTGGAPNGATRIKGILNRVQPDVTVIQDDSWNVGILVDQMGLMNLSTPTVGYVAVDSENVRKDVAVQLQSLKHVICHTQFGVDQLRLAGYRGKASTAGHGVDTALYYPVDKLQARGGLGKKRDWRNTWLWGVVGANQNRKRLDLSVAYFANWWDFAGKPDDAFLFIHTDTNGMWDLRQIADYYGVRNRVMTTEGGPTLPEDQMPTMYSALDAMISTAGGESWGLTHLEAMACGVPQIAVKCGGMPFWAGDAIAWVDPSVYVFTPNRTNTKLHIPTERDFVHAMHQLYNDRELQQALITRGLAVAKDNTWEKVADHFDQVLSEVVKTNRVVTEVDCMSEFA